MKVGTNATPSASEDGVCNCSEQLQLTVDSGTPSRVAFDIFWCWKDDHLQMSEYFLQDKYKGEVTNITENVYTLPGVCSSNFHITEEGIFVFPSVTGGDQTKLCSQEIQINLNLAQAVEA